MGEPDGPEDRARVHWSVPPPPPMAESEVPAANQPLGEEFLFHLYRGSELLKEDHVYEAKSELERAIALQPKDVEGQSLLGIVYFRLGHYPRAIQIYEDLLRARPKEVAPRINLALCYMKTGQLPSARLILEEIVQHRPDHVRAWGYLGLTHQRLGDYDKAAVAFDRAGRPQLAERLRAMRGAEAANGQEDDVQEIAHQDARISQPPPALSPPVEAEPSPPSRRPSGSWRAGPRSSVPAAAARVSVPAGLDQVSHEASLVFPERPRVVVHPDGVVLARVDRAFHVRSDGLRAALPDTATGFRSSLLRRRGRGLVADEALGSLAAPFVTLEGAGRLVLGAPDTLSPLVVTLDGEPLYVREDRLLGFDGSVEHESGRLSLDNDEVTGLVHLSGKGFVVVAARVPLHGLEVMAGHSAQFRASRLIGWVGRLLSRPLPPEQSPSALRGLVTLSGTGIVLTDGG